MQRTSHDKLSDRNVDPVFQHLEGFRDTYNYIGRQLHLGARATGNPSENGEDHTPRSTFARAARHLGAELQDKDPRKIYADILGRLPAYADALMMLPDRRSENYDPFSISKEQHDQAVASTIAFNDIIRDTINNHPRLSADILVKLVAAGLNRYRYPEDEKTLVLEHTRGVMKGIKHELAFESLLYYLPEGFEILDTTDQDDAHGADFKVRCPNGVIVSIDVKATERLEREARQRKWGHFAKRGEKPPANEIILYSGFTDADFESGSPWRPSQESIEHVLPSVEHALLQASGDRTFRDHKTLAK